MVDGPKGRQRLEHIGPTAERSDRKSTPDHLAEAPQIGLHSAVVGRSSLAQAKPGDHLVEDEQCARLVAGRPQPGQEALGRRHQAHVGGDRLHDHAGHLVVDLGDHVVGRDDGVGNRARRHAGGVRKAEGGHAAAAAGQEAVGVPVIAAVELEDAVPAREPACHADGAHGRFGSRRHQADLLAPGDPMCDRLGQQDFAFGRGAERRPLASGRPHGGHHFGVGVPENRGAIGLHEVQELVSVGVPDVGALSPGHEVGMPANGPEGPDGRVDASGDHPFGAGEQRLGHGVRHHGSLAIRHRAPRPAHRRSR